VVEKGGFCGGVIMKKILGLALAGALSVAALPAVAADYPLKAPPPPLWTWTGFYVGVQAGAGWDHTRWTNGAGLTTGDIQGSGGVIGGTLGWNWQNGPWVFGIEGDLSWTNLNAVSAAAACVITCTTRVDWLGTLRARLGHTNGPLLFYITGGGAWAGEKNTLVAGGVAQTVNDTASGWAAGAGLEGMLGGGWSLKGEYLYVALGSALACGLPVCGPTNVNADYLRIHLVRAGVNYKF
jgi:outer membrane immunogenic protein